MLAFSYYPDIFVELFDKVEKEVLSRKENTEPERILNILQAFSLAGQGSEELYEYLDKVIGKNINNIEADEIAGILNAFSGTPYSREKLFILFHRWIKELKE